MQDSVLVFFEKRHRWNAEYVEALAAGRYPHQPKAERTYSNTLKQFVTAPTAVWMTSIDSQSAATPMNHEPGRVTLCRIDTLEAKLQNDNASRLAIEGTHRLATAEEVTRELAEQEARRQSYRALDAQKAGVNQGNTVVIPRVTA